MTQGVCLCDTRGVRVCVIQGVCLSDTRWVVFVIQMHCDLLGGFGGVVLNNYYGT